MSEWGEPRRWNESDLPDDLRRVLESAEVDDDRSRLQSLEGRLAPMLGWSVGATAATGAGSAAASTGAAGGAATGAAGAGAAGGSVAAGAGAASTAGATAAGAASAVKVLVATVVTAGAIGGGAWVASETTVPDPGPAPPQTQSVTAPAPAPDPMPSQGDDAVATPETEPEDDIAPEPAPFEVAPGATRDRPSEPRHRIQPASTPGPSEPATDEEAPEASDALADEVAAIDAIRRALGTPRRALELADAHRARFGDGVLGPERELLRIEALLALDREDEAHALAEDLLARHPRSAHARRLRRLLREHTRASPVADNPYGPGPRDTAR